MGSNEVRLIEWWSCAGESAYWCDSWMQSGTADVTQGTLCVSFWQAIGIGAGPA